MSGDDHFLVHDLKMKDDLFWNWWKAKPSEKNKKTF